MSRLKIFIAPATIHYTDYGSHLETVHGIQWCDDYGDPVKGAFELGKTVAQKRSDLEPYEAQIELVELPVYARTVDMNPRGDI